MLDSRKLNTTEKLLGVVIIIVSFFALYLISVFNPPTFVQIICAFLGVFVCLIGIVVLFSEGSILEARREIKASKVK